MFARSRRQFLRDVGSGMVVAGVGAGLAGDLGFSSAFAAEGADELSFGQFEPLVKLMQDTPPDKLQPVLIKKIKEGNTNLKELTAAAALANAEKFGGEDYIGFHTAMAFLPAYKMSRELSGARQALPVLKVLYRNADQIQQQGGGEKMVLKSLKATDSSADADVGARLRDASRKGNIKRAEEIFAAVGQGTPEGAFNQLQLVVQDDINVHRFVLAHRAFGLIKLVGSQYAHTLLRQCVRLCVTHEQNRIRSKRNESPIRALMPKLIDQYSLAGRKLGKRKVDDAWIEKMSQTIYKADASLASDAVAAALAEGIDPEAVGESISLAANMLVLRQGTDRWRCHGDSPGVHGSDALNAWRNMARVTDDLLAMTGLIVGAFHTAHYQPFDGEAYPTDDHRKQVKATGAKRLLAEAEDAIRHNDQGRAAAAVQIYGEQGFAPRPVFDLMLKYTISEDGRLHGE